MRDLHAAPAALAASNVNGQLMDRLDAMDAALAERDRRLLEADAELRALRGSLEAAQGMGAGQAGELEEARVELAALRAQAAEAQAALAAAQAATTAQTADLRAAVISRDKKLRALQVRAQRGAPECNGSPELARRPPRCVRTRACRLRWRRSRRSSCARRRSTRRPWQGSSLQLPRAAGGAPRAAPLAPRLAPPRQPQAATRSRQWQPLRPRRG